ncbi:MAG: DNA-formamidopyrimidine glycosylase family protein [Promethearchaeota archaeon]
MSIELPEALILTKQMTKELVGKQIHSWYLQDFERLIKVGFLNKNIKDFDQLVKGKVQSVVSRGNSIVVKLDNKMNLLLAPEYGGKILYHEKNVTIPKKVHLLVQFSDNTSLTVRLTSMGCIYAANDKELKQLYIYERDFSGTLSPIDVEFTFKRFSQLIAGMRRNIKSVLVGKDAVIVGVSNSAFQDIIYRAKIHPKVKVSELTTDERKTVFYAIKTLIQERIKFGGKDQFLDLYGNSGKYIPTMGPNMKNKACHHCGTTIEKLSMGGGQVYYCPRCQVPK